MATRGRKKNGGKKLNTSTGKQTDDKRAPVYNITNYINPSGCQNIQIGENNQLTLVDQAKKLLENTESEGVTKDDAIIYMLFTILNPKCSMKPDAMKIGVLRDLFEKTYKNIKPGQHQSFKDIAGTDLLPFLDIHYKWFEVSVGKNCEYMVRALVRKQRQKKKHLSSELDSVSIKSSERADDTDYQSALSCVSDIENWDETYSSSNERQLSFESIIDKNDFSVGEDTEEDEDIKMTMSKWIEVRRKRRKPYHSKNPDSLHSDISLNEDEESDKKIDMFHSEESKISLFKNLIGRFCGDSLLILASDNCYEKDHFKFMLDVVSMWNTPNRTTSYILIGVVPKSSPPHQLIGIQCKRSDAFYQELFHTHFFNIRPTFRYAEVEFESLFFGIIEIPSSAGCGIPSITKEKAFHEDKCYFEPNQLWYHTNEGPKCCNMADTKTGLIYSWFLTTEGADKKNSVPQKSDKYYPVRKIKGTKKAGTSTSSSSTYSDDIHVLKNPQSFSKEMGNFAKNNYVLVTGDLVPGMKHLEAISLVPWVAVYDFDIYSRDKGLLSATEQSLRKRRSLHISHLKARPPNLSEDATVWTFLRGCREIPETRIENENDCRKWFKQVKAFLKNHVDQLQKFAFDYTVLNIVIFWPKTEFLAQFMHKFITKIDDEIDPTPKFIACLPSTPKDNIGKSVYDLLCSEYGDHLTIMKMDLDKVCLEIKHSLQNQHLQQNVKYELPTSDGSQNPSIEESEAAWLKEDMDVLYLQNVFKMKGGPVTLDKLKDETDQFFKGGNLQWFTWYECGTGLDVDRDIKSNIVTKINNLLEENKCNTFSLYHEPGSGGTTLAQRIIWEYHSHTPCIQIRLNTSSSLSDIAEKIEYLHNKTHKQIIMMVDGEDDIKMKTLMQIIRNGPAVVIAIYVKRLSEKIGDIQSRNGVLLKGNVSSREAKRLALQFSSRCDDDTKKNGLEKLSKEVENKINHCLYEFGLTTYQHEFKGISAYVKGYLNLDQRRDKELLPWQKMLGYLSLVYYYGQTSLPCQFFSNLLYLPSNYDVTFEDFSHPVDKFVVPSINEGRSKNIRICHYLIAKEILEQILSRHTTKSGEREADLSVTARKNLADFFMEFIEFASKKNPKASSNITHILTKTFIVRDNKFVVKHTEQTKKRPVISKALTDISSKPPLYTERLYVLEKLTNSFPSDPNFHAHLGRFYAYCRPDDEKKAEKCFEKALELCNKYINDKDISEIEERWRLSFMHIYHMYGTVLQKRILKIIAFSSPTKTYESNDDLLAKLDELVELAETACIYFQKCREFAPPGCETTAGHVGEITVRLHVCDFVQKNFERSNESHGIQKFLSTFEKEERRGVIFVKHSVSLIDSLIMECYTEIDENDHTDYPLQKVVLWYNHLFQPKNVDLEKFATGDDIFSHRLRIAAKKLQYSQCHKGESFTLLDNITSADDLKDIVHHYEEIFRSISSSVVDKRSNKLLERDYIEWLFAIRHQLFQEDYDLENVLLTVKQWNDYLKSPLSKFYLFILTSLLGFGTNEEKGKTECLLEAQIIKEELHKLSKFVLKPRYPREWLGKSGSGIKGLHPGTRLLGFHPDDQEVKPFHQSELARCKGTVCPPNTKKSNGLIYLDLGNNTVPVKVFYIPNVASLAGSQYAGRRVEFILGFSLDHGYEAFEVNLLNKYGCSTCSNKEEILCLHESAECSNCGQVILKDELNVAD